MWRFLAAFAALSSLPMTSGAQFSLEEKLEILTQEMEEVKEQLKGQSSTATISPAEGVHGDALTAGGTTTLGGYGELHYNNLDSKDELDFHRFVLFFGHRFSDRLRFQSELELEHSLVEDTDDGSGPGEVELEQAFIDFDLSDRHTARGGLFLLPVGILNETHEPTTFYGVERNPVETNIIPTTWWEGGAQLYGRLGEGGWGYDLALTSGLKVPTTGSSAYKIRSGRQKVAKADANDAAGTLRIKWAGLSGLQLAATVQRQNDVTQAAGAPGTAASATLIEVHALAERGPWALRTLYARWDLSGSSPKVFGRDEQYGYYVEPSFKFTPKLGVFARYNMWDNEAGDAADSKKKQTDVGLNYWPHENVVIKFDVINQSGAIDDNGFNLGLGYMF